MSLMVLGQIEINSGKIYATRVQRNIVIYAKYLIVYTFQNLIQVYYFLFMDDDKYKPRFNVKCKRVLSSHFFMCLYSCMSCRVFHVYANETFISHPAAVP